MKPFLPSSENKGITAVLLVLGTSLGTLTIGWYVTTHPGNTLPLLLAGGLAGLIILLRWPSSPVTFFYPLVWGFWSLTLPLVGRPDRLLALLGLAGFLILIQRKRLKLPILPPLILIGMILLMGSYLISWLWHSWLSEAQEMVVSFAMRLLFLYLVYFHIRTREQLKLTMKVFLTSSILMAVLTLAASLYGGFGFIRLPDQASRVQQLLGSFIHLVGSTGLVTASALLIAGLFPIARRKSEKTGVIFLSFFLLWMAFAAEFRREILITIPIILFILIADRKSRLRKPAIILSIASVALFFLFILPNSDILQNRLQTETIRILEGSETRIIGYEISLQAFLANPFGYGPNSYRSVAFDFLGPGFISYTYNSYSVFTLVAVEAGIFALFGVILILLGATVEALQSRNTAVNVEGWVLSSAPGLVLIVIIWFAFGQASQQSLPWFILGIILSANQIAKTEKKPVLPGND